MATPEHFRRSHPRRSLVEQACGSIPRRRRRIGRGSRINNNSSIGVLDTVSEIEESEQTQTEATTIGNEDILETEEIEETKGMEVIEDGATRLAIGKVAGRIGARTFGTRTSVLVQIRTKARDFWRCHHRRLHRTSCLWTVLRAAMAGVMTSGRAILQTEAMNGIPIGRATIQVAMTTGSRNGVMMDGSPASGRVHVGQTHKITVEALAEATMVAEPSELRRRLHHVRLQLPTTQGEKAKHPRRWHRSPTWLRRWPSCRGSWQRKAVQAQKNGGVEARMIEEVEARAKAAERVVAASVASRAIAALAFLRRVF